MSPDPLIDTWGAVRAIDPEFAEAARILAELPEKEQRLTPRMRELCRLAVDAAATHLYAPGIRTHISRALDHGATQAEILEVLELAATVGIHSMNIGVPLLVEVLVENGRPGPAPLSEHQEQLKEEFTRTRGYWHAFWDETLELDPEMFEAYVRFSAAPWRTGPLSLAEKELVYISYDIAATHLYAPGTKLHIRNALAHGATVDEVLGAMEIASMIGLQSIETAVPVLLDEVARRTETN